MIEVIQPFLAPAVMFSGGGLPPTAKMHREIYRGFDEAEILIVFPQREMHFDSEQPIRIAIDTPPDN